ncbi:MAG: NAD-dependent epimerase/dehydratase family protein [Pseudomonadota bacterium]|nr:NAD-dependent epimerase/dehydratase family protein [Pseudomonadota bacterium]
MILLTGATGFLGKRVSRQLQAQGLPFKATSQSLGVDLRNRSELSDLMADTKPDYILNCAAFVGGIQFGHQYPVELFQNNLQMTLNLLEAAQQFGVTRVVNPISNCAYPGDATLFKEDQFWDGPLHESVMVYGFVRKASWVGAWAYAQQYKLDVMNIILSNMYGPQDHFDAERSHALGALIMKFVEAKQNDSPHVDVWGNGKPVREWLHVDDGAQAMIRAMSVAPSLEPINIGIAKGISVIEMAKLISDIVGYEGEIKLDLTKLDGAPYKTVDGTRGRSHFGWQPEINFEQGVRDTIAWYLEHKNTV